MIFFVKKGRVLTISIKQCIRFRYHCLKLNKITQNPENISVALSKYFTANAAEYWEA